ncbi:MAG: S8 family serine peptidase [Candidatus Cloacimonetes bacterium]|nr:S8 family serine peptidase [Candidatus Cloacimonadota bacterium]
MKKILFTLVIMISIIITCHAENYLKGSLLFKSNTTIKVNSVNPLLTDKDWFNDLIKEYNIYSIRQIGENSIPTQYQSRRLYYSICFDTTYSVSDVINSFEKNDDVLYAKYNIAFEPVINSNDTYANQMWGLDRINLQQVWNSGVHGSGEVIVAVIDSGLDLGLNNYPSIHEDLVGNVWSDVNPMVTPLNPYYGFNPYFYLSSNGEHPYLPQDKYGHGTHVAGTISAKNNNLTGVASVSG